MRGIGWMGSTMALGWRRGPRGVGTGGSTTRGSATGLGSIGFTPAMFMPDSGLVGRAMAVGCTRARMGAGTWGSSSGALSMALDTTILGMEMVGLVGFDGEVCARECCFD